MLFCCCLVPGFPGGPGFWIPLPNIPLPVAPVACVATTMGCTEATHGADAACDTADPTMCTGTTPGPVEACHAGKTV